MKKISSILVLLGLFVFCAYTQDPPEKSENGPKKASYDELLSKLKGGDATIDFKALRLSYTDTKDYSSYGADPDLRNKMLKAFNEKNYNDAIKSAEEILKKNYVEINSHMIMAASQRELGDSKKFEFHKAVYLGLINSITSGADGKTPKTAYVVIYVPEEYAVIQALGYQRGSQALFTEDGHKYDILTVTDPKTKETLKLYFNIDIVWKSYEKMFKD